MAAAAAAAPPAQASSPPPPSSSYAPRKPVALKTPGRVDLADVTHNNIGQLRKINAVLFPVRFSDAWYKDVREQDVGEVCKFALFNDIPVGTVCCRFEFLSKTEVKLYIMTLGTLAPYRRLGIATKLLQHVMDVAGPGKSIELKDPNAPTPKPKKGKDGKEVKQEPVRKKYKVLSAYLHVQTSNEDAKAFYEKAGFAVKELLPEYHRPNVEPRSAWLLEKTS